MDSPERMSVRGAYWLVFFTIIIASWSYLYSMSLSMNMDLFGRGMSMESSTSEMNSMSNMGSMSEMKSSPVMKNGSSTEIIPSNGSDDMNSSEMGSKSSDEKSAKINAMNSSEVTNSMGSMPSMASDMNMDMPMTRFLPLFGMWAVMMAAMMLPTMVPSLKIYEELMVSANGTRVGWIGVLLGYSIVWVVFAIVITTVQLLLLSFKFVDMMGLVKSFWVSALLLVVAGAYQFTRAKEVCHGVCHSPMMYFIGHWQNGFGGGIRMGLGLGAFCVGCCWLFMVLGFAGGVMNFLWMGLATLFMIIEKLPEIGHRIVRPMGILLILAGFGCAAWTYQVKGLI